MDLEDWLDNGCSFNLKDLIGIRKAISNVKKQNQNEVNRIKRGLNQFAKVLLFKSKQDKKLDKFKIDFE